MFPNYLVPVKEGGSSSSTEVRHGLVNLTDGDNHIDFLQPMSAAGYTIIWMDMDGIGFNAPSNQTVNGFDITNVLTNGRMSYIAILN